MRRSAMLRNMSVNSRVPRQGMSVAIRFASALLVVSGCVAQAGELETDSTSDGLAGNTTPSDFQAVGSRELSRDPSASDSPRAAALNPVTDEMMVAPPSHLVPMTHDSSHWNVGGNFFSPAGTVKRIGTTSDN